MSISTKGHIRRYVRHDDLKNDSTAHCLDCELAEDMYFGEFAHLIKRFYWGTFAFGMATGMIAFAALALIYGRA